MITAAAARGCVACTVAMLVACAANPYERYLAAHPGWTAETFPEVGTGFSEALAALFAPAPRGTSARTVKIEVYEVAPGGWEALDAAALKKETWTPSPLADYLLLAKTFCSQRRSLLLSVIEATSWYLFEGDRMVAYQHYRFPEGGACLPKLEQTNPELFRQELRKLIEGLVPSV